MPALLAYGEASRRDESGGGGEVVGCESFAKPFYLSQEWRRAREACLKKAGYLCERCLKKGLITPAQIVHHRIHLTPENIKDSKIRSGLDNLEALCFSCHEREHKSRHRYMVDAEGHIVGRDVAETPQNRRGEV